MSALRPTSLPWRRPQHELLLLALVAVAALAPVNPASLEDVSRLCLTQSLVHGRFSVDSCAEGTVDRSSRGGHLYTITGPGMSALEIPAAKAVRLRSPEHWAADRDVRLWIVRVLSSGIAFLVCAFLVGRISEGLAPGFGGASLVAFGLGTLLAPMAGANFDQVPAAALGLGAFALAWRGRPLLAGLAAGAALTVEYQAATILLVVGAYTALGGGRALLRFAVGALPGALLLGAYDWTAFGAPWRTPFDYADNGFRSGLLGVHRPTAHAAWSVFLGDRGLLVASPIVVGAAIGLALLWRRGHQAEAAACGAITALFAVAACGYLDPNSGVSPGPRYVAPALPFLAIGLGPVFARLRLSTSVLAGLSIIPTIAIALTWASGIHYRHTIWRQLAPYPARLGSSPLLPYLDPTAFNWAGLSQHLAALLIALAAASALAVALADSRRR